MAPLGFPPNPEGIPQHLSTRVTVSSHTLTLLPDPGPGGKLNTDLEGRDDKAENGGAIIPH